MLLTLLNFEITVERRSSLTPDLKERFLLKQEK